MVMIRSKCYPHKWVWLYAQWDRHTDTRLMLYSIHYRCSLHNKNCRDDNIMHECNITFQRHNNNTDIWNYKFSPLLRYTGKKAKIITVWDLIITSRGQCGSKLGWLSSMTEILCTEKLTFAKSDEQYSSSVEELTTRRLCFLPPMSHDGIQQMSGIFHNKNLWKCLKNTFMQTNLI